MARNNYICVTLKSNGLAMLNGGGTMEYHDYIRCLERRGFVQVGGGFFSRVFAHPKVPDRVLKICGTNDMGWVSYILWAQQTPFRRRFAPKLYSLKFHDSFYVAVMERVHVGPNDSETMEYVEHLRGWPKRGSDSAERRYPGLRMFMKMLLSRFNDDLHRGNYGHRDDGSLCIFDPTTGTLDRNKTARPVRYRSSRRLAA